MCFGFLRAAGNCVRSLFALLFCLICGGPILFIIGLVLLLSGNDREDNVKEYNNAVNSQSTSVSNSWLPGTIGGATAGATQVPITVNGDLEDVQSASSYVVRATPATTTSLAYSLNNVNSFTRSGISTSRVFENTAYCDNSYGCSNSQMQSYCVANFGNSASFGSGSCSGRGNCGVCRYTAYLTDYCVVLDGNSAPYTQSTTYQSCYYPFGEVNQLYTSRTPPSTITATVMSASDPFIVIQRLTDGTNDFGITKSSQRRSGLICLILGIVMIACIALVGFLFYKFFTRDKQNGGGKPSPSVPNQAPYYPSQPQQQPYAPTPAPANPTGYTNSYADPGGLSQPTNTTTTGYGNNTAPAAYGYGYGTPPPAQPPAQAQPTYGYGYS